MGYDLQRFVGDVDEELICLICSGVLEDPLQTSACEHAFCRSCITEWMSREPICPVDRQPLTTANLRSVPRIMRNLLSRLCLSCENTTHGCTTVVKLDCLSTHLLQCEFNPKRLCPCDQGCGLVIPKDELREHNCVRELRSQMNAQQNKIQELKQDLSEHSVTIDELKREVHILKDFIRAMRVSNPAMRAIADQMEHAEVERWSSTLQRARVTRWGGMISTPDEVLRMMIKRAVSESGCPPHILDELMENCHERRWPPGLFNLETRQSNRRLYESYICKRVPGKQAVLVLHCDNSHMSSEMMIEPGLVMIFAHGVE